MKKKIEIALAIIITVLSLVLAIVYFIDGRWIIAALFALIAVLNGIGLILRLK